VTAAFAALDAPLQVELLTRSWRRFDDRAFLPLVRRLALAPTAGDDALRDIASRRWHELAPRAARAAQGLAPPDRRARADTPGRASEEASGAAIPPARGQARLIRVSSPTPGAEQVHQFFLDDMVLTGTAALLQRLAQYPRGERFQWMDRQFSWPEIERWPPAERARLARDVRRRAAALGLVIEPARPAW
jgi:hypothetical protein